MQSKHKEKVFTIESIFKLFFLTFNFKAISNVSMEGSRLTTELYRLKFDWFVSELTTVELDFIVGRARHPTPNLSHFSNGP